MKKMISGISIASAIAISWMCGIVGYFMVISSYYRKRERREENQRNTSAYIDSINARRTGGAPTVEVRKIAKPSEHIVHPDDSRNFRGRTPHKWGYYDH